MIITNDFYRQIFSGFHNPMNNKNNINLTKKREEKMMRTVTLMSNPKQDNQSVSQRIESYPKHFDNTVDISMIPNNHKCNACQGGWCDSCFGTSRCDCLRVNHGVEVIGESMNPVPLVMINKELTRQQTEDITKTLYRPVPGLTPRRGARTSEPGPRSQDFGPRTSDPGPRTQGPRTQDLSLIRES